MLWRGFRSTATFAMAAKQNSSISATLVMVPLSTIMGGCKSDDGCTLSDGSTTGLSVTDILRSVSTD